MDVLFFMTERTNFIRHYYDQAALPFSETIRKIENEEPPFHDPPYSEDIEPAYFSEWLEANSCLQMLGRSCVSMLAGSLKLYFQQWEHFLVDKWKPEHRKKVFKPGLIQGYKFCFGEVAKIDWASCPVDLDVLEQIILLRNIDQHPEHISSIGAGYWGKARRRFSHILFTEDAYKLASDDPNAIAEIWGPPVSVTRNDLFAAIQQVEQLANWMEPQLQRTRWPRAKMDT